MASLNLKLNDIRKRDIQFITLVIAVGIMLTSYTTSLSAFISPTGELRWETSVLSFDQPDYSGGETVIVTGFLEEGTEYMEGLKYYSFLTGEPIRCTVVVLSPSKMPIHLESIVISDAQGDITLDPISFSAGSEVGTYTVRIIIWTDFLPSGVTRTNAISEGTFEVV